MFFGVCFFDFFARNIKKERFGKVCGLFFNPRPAHKFRASAPKKGCHSYLRAIVLFTKKQKCLSSPGGRDTIAPGNARGMLPPPTKQSL
jgi:hypothetical protein